MLFFVRVFADRTDIYGRKCIPLLAKPLSIKMMPFEIGFKSELFLKQHKFVRHFGGAAFFKFEGLRIMKFNLLLL